MKKMMRALSLALVCVMLMPLIVGCQPVEDPDHKHAFIKMVATTEFLSEEGSCAKKTTYFYSCECGEKGTEVFEGDYAYDHVFDQKNTDSKYLKESGSCSTRALYYYSCKCGEKGNNLFEGDYANGHVFDQKNTDEKFVKENGSCTKKASYYYSCKCGEIGTEFFEGDFAHNFGAKITNATTFASDSTETSATKFYNSCTKCGEKVTFEFGKSDSERAPVGSKVKEKLDGKKILFAGCSYNYYGKIVNAVNVTNIGQKARDHDKGFFYELCKQNGATVTVHNWCFGGHDLTDLFGESCNADRKDGNGTNHLAQLKDRYFDYVSLLDIPWPKIPSLEEYLVELQRIMKLFTDENPNCKFIYSIPCGAYWYNYADKTNFKETYVGTVYAKEIAKLPNTIVIDQGRIPRDIIMGDTKVPNSTFTYNANSFVVAEDGHHPNLLSGYINTLMTYCAITGETAVGQPLELQNEYGGTQGAPYRKENFITNFYGGKADSTNFIQIMESPSEMLGIQKVVNRYLDMQTYLYY